MTNQPPPSDPKLPRDADSPVELHENLVAYLDGELPETAVRDVEQQLAQNPLLRRNVEAYQKAWELLDELPQIRATEQFTTRTVASLKIETNPTAGSRTGAISINTGEVRSQQRVSQRSTGAGTTPPLAIAAWFLGLAVSAAAGYLITNRMVPRSTDRLLEDFPVIEKFDKFKDVGSLEFLKQYRDLKKGESDRVPLP